MKRLLLNNNQNLAEHGWKQFLVQLNYCLYYREEFEPDGVEIVAERPKEVSDVHKLEDITTSKHAGNDFQHSLFCDKPEGRIGARSRLRLVFTYKPCKSGLFDFSLYAKIRSVVSDNDQVAMVSNDEAIVMRMSTTMGSEYIDETQLVEDLAALPLTATIQARAAFPKLLFEDIRTESDMQISDIDYLWNRFSFPKLNYDLSVPLTAKEIALNNSSSPDLSQLVVYPCEFAPAVIHSPTQTVDIVLRNHGYLQTAFRMSLPNEKQLELENWCDEDEPSEALNRIICIIEELKLFTIEPKSGVLGPGESMVVRMTYKHSSLKYNGIHNLPVLVRISQGKQFYLDIRGRTLAGQTTNRRSSVKIMEPRLQSSGGTLPPPTANASLDRTGVGSAAGNSLSKTSQGGRETVPSSLPDILLVLGSALVPDNIVTLDPVPIGLSYVPTVQAPLTEGTSNDCAPLQRIELVNVSAYHIQYEVIIGSPYDASLTSDEFVRQNNHTFDVLSIANPRGNIPTGGSVYLEWYFYPIEAKHHSIPFYVKYSIVPPSSIQSSMFPLLEDNDSFGLGSPIGGSAIGFNNTVSAAGSKVVPSSRRGMTGSTRTVSTGKPGTTSRAQQMAEKAAAEAANAAALAHTLILTGTINCVGYDPRVPKPNSHESQYIGGLPPIRPVLKSADKMITCFEDVVDFGTIPQRSLAHRVILLENRSTTGVYDFAFDTTSCSLCNDQLLSFSPVSGRIEPGSQVVIQVSLKAMAQSIIFVTEHVKIIIREVLKAAARSKGGTKALLLNKLRARKAVNTPHDSVVGRLTVARSMYVVTEPEVPSYVLENGDMSAAKNALDKVSARPQGKFPTTISEKGETVIPDVSRALRNTLGAGHATAFFVEGEEEEAVNTTGTVAGLSLAGSYAETMQIQSLSGPPSPTERTNASRASRSAGGDDSRSRTSGTSGRQSASRGTLETGASGRSTGTSGGGHQLFGSTYILMVRIKGAILSSQTIDRLYARNAPFTLTSTDEAVNNGVINKNREFLQLCRSEHKEFIPPVGKKFYDDNVREELLKARNKAKVNLSMVFGRDPELRSVCQELFQGLSQLLVSKYEIRDTLQDVLHPPDLTQSSTPHQSVTYGLTSLLQRTPTSAVFLDSSSVALMNVTGVYAKEIFDLSRQRSLHQDCILYLKALGHSSKALNQQEQELEELEDAQRDVYSHMDDKAREDLQLRDEDSYTLSVVEVKREFLEALGLNSSPAFVRDWELTESNMVASARAVPNSARSDNSATNSNAGSSSMLIIKDWIYTLSKDSQRDIQQAVQFAKDDLLRRRRWFSQSSNADNLNLDGDNGQGDAGNNSVGSDRNSSSRNPNVTLALGDELGSVHSLGSTSQQSHHHNSGSHSPSPSNRRLLHGPSSSPLGSPSRNSSNNINNNSNNSNHPNHSRPNSSPTKKTNEDDDLQASSSLLSMALRPDFYSTAADTLNALFLNIVRDIVDTAALETLEASIEQEE